MPYGRRRTFRRRSYRRFARRSRGTARTFRRKVRSTIYRMSETKQGVRTLDNVAFTEAITYLPLVPLIAQGPGDNQRIGNKVMSQWFTINLFFYVRKSPSATIETDKTFRIYIVWPKNTSSSDTTAMFTSANFPLHGLPDQDNFIYWKDQKYFTHTTSEFGRKDYINLKMYKRFRYHIEFKSSGNTEAPKMPYMVISTVADPNVTTQVSGYIKMSFKDI